MRTININGNRFALPEGMSTKDIQALVGFLATLQTVESHYDYSCSDYLYSLGRGPELRLEDITPTENARAKSGGAIGLEAIGLEALALGRALWLPASR